MMQNISKKYRNWRAYAASLFTQGLSPPQLSLSITLGILIGLMPLFGVATVTVTALALYLRVNLPLAIFMSYVVTPFHLLLFIPFIRLGEWITGAVPSKLTLAALKEIFAGEYFDALTFMASQLACGILGWTVAAIPGAFLFYHLAKAIFTHQRP